MSRTTVVTPTNDHNPYQQWLQRITLIMKKQNATGWITLRGTDEIDDDHDIYDSDNDEEYNSLVYTQREVNYIRCILMTPERENAIDEMTRLIHGDGYADKQSPKMFNPAVFSSTVLSAFESFHSTFKSKRLWSKKLNILFGFTMTINQYDSWLDNNEVGKMDGMINELLALWKKVLKRSSTDLGKQKLYY